MVTGANWRVIAGAECRKPMPLTTWRRRSSVRSLRAAVRRPRRAVRRARSARAGKCLWASTAGRASARTMAEFGAAAKVTRRVMGKVVPLGTVMPMVPVMSEVVAMWSVTMMHRSSELRPAVVIATGVPVMAMVTATVPREPMFAAVMAIVCYAPMTLMTTVVGEVVTMTTVAKLSALREMARPRSA